MTELWTPGRAKDVVEVQGADKRVQPTVRKSEGGSQFDDELQLMSERDRDIAREGRKLVEHLQQRPDHTVYVGSAESRDQLRQVFNVWFRSGALTHHPDIRIDYGVVEGSIRIDEAR